MLIRDVHTLRKMKLLARGQDGWRVHTFGREWLRRSIISFCCRRPTRLNCFSILRNARASANSLVTCLVLGGNLMDTCRLSAADPRPLALGLPHNGAWYLESQ